MKERQLDQPEPNPENRTIDEILLSIDPNHKPEEQIIIYCLICNEPIILPHLEAVNCPQMDVCTNCHKRFDLDESTRR